MSKDHGAVEATVRCLPADEARPRIAELSESALRRLGFARMFASPVTVLAERCAS